ncbi:DUF6789 family protein [Flavobacterium sp. ZT3R25]|uniref:DUF6789 family protein n=1 Tax=Flavobacterium galactosi TaxID=3398735 RepID=UPI003A8B7B2F
MNTKIIQSLISGVIGAAVMSIEMWVATMMGMPKMNPPDMLSVMLGVPIIVGWLIHFMIGIIFAMAYTFFFINLVNKISNAIFRGAIFGVAVFIFAQIMLAILGAIMEGTPPMEGSLLLIMLGSIIGHIIFGIVVALFVKEEIVVE